MERKRGWDRRESQDHRPKGARNSQRQTKGDAARKRMKDEPHAEPRRQKANAQRRKVATTQDRSNKIDCEPMQEEMD